MAPRAGERDHRAGAPDGGGKKKLVILAAFLVGELDDYDCGKCSEDSKKVRGCVDEADIVLFHFADGTPLKSCPVRSITPEIFGVARAYRFREKGILPVAGGWLDQSASLVAALTHLDAEIATYAGKK